MKSIFYSLLFFFSQNRTFSYFTILVAIAAVTFFFSWLTDPRRLINGLFFTFFIFSLAAWFTFLVYATNLPSFRRIYLMVGAFLVSLVAFIVFFSWTLLLWNSYVVLKHESHTLPNLLTLILAIAMLVLWAFIFIGHLTKSTPTWFRLLLDMFPTIAFYLAAVMYNFLINLLLYQIVPRRYHQDYLVVLGAGLINGNRLSNIQAARINRAIQFAYHQQEKGQPFPKFIMSGGQGPNETISEASAMALTPLNGGSQLTRFCWRTSPATPSRTWSSPRLSLSTTTAMTTSGPAFSPATTTCSALLSTPKKLAWTATASALTPGYYLPNAVLREFAGILVMNRLRHFTVMALIVAAYVALAICKLLNVF